VTSHDKPGPAAGIDTSTPNPARIYDALLGGKDHFPADRAAAHAILNIAPQARRGAKQNRAFLQRAVRFLAREAGIRQFLDIGTGLPTQGNVHEVAQAVAADARVVYVDHDLVVHVHANALLADNTSTVAVLADLREPEAILGHPEVRRLLDFTRPVAVLLVAVLHFLTDAEDPAGIVARLRDAMVPGSYLVLSHATGDFHPQVGAKVAEVYQQASAPLVLRSRSQIERFFDGFDLVAPGLVEPAAWRPDQQGQGRGSAGGFYSGVGRKPAASTRAGQRDHTGRGGLGGQEGP
jgi:S-adenosyl methyltransferase